MSMSPTTPNFQNVKTFFQRPEGKTGLFFLIVGGLALAYASVTFIFPLVLLFLTDMIHIAILLGITLAGIYVLTNKKFRSIVKNLFQLSMRWLTSMVIELDPIGILKNTLDQMRKQNEELSKGIAGCAGAKKQLENQIQSNNNDIQHSKSLIDQVTLQLQRERDPMKQQLLNLNKTRYLQEVGRRMKSNENMGNILNQTTRMYNMLTRWQNLAEFNIENTADQIKNADQERKSILASYKALGPAQRLIKGDPQELQMFNQTLEYLAEDNANKLGAMEDFSRYSEKFLSNMDIEQGASAADAEKMLSQYEKKLLSAGGIDNQVPTKVTRIDAVPVARSAGAVDGDYLEDLTK